MKFEPRQTDVPADLDRSWKVRVGQEAPNQARGLQGLIQLLDREMAAIKKRAESTPTDASGLTLVGSREEVDISQAVAEAQKIAADNKRRAGQDEYVFKQLTKGKQLLEAMAQSGKPWSEAAQALGWDEGTALEIMKDLGEAVDASAGAELNGLEIGLDVQTVGSGPKFEEQIQQYLQARDARNVLMRIQEIVKEAD